MDQRRPQKKRKYVSVDYWCERCTRISCLKMKGCPSTKKPFLSQLQTHWNSDVCKDNLKTRASTAPLNIPPMAIDSTPNDGRVGFDEDDGMSGIEFGNDDDDENQQTAADEVGLADQHQIYQGGLDAILDFQGILLESYSLAIPFNVRIAKIVQQPLLATQMRSCSWKDYVSIYTFVQEKGLSQQSGNELLGLIRGATVGTIRFPKKYQSIDRACRKFASIYTERLIRIDFDKQILGSNFPPMERTCLDVRQVIGRCLLQKDPTYFFTKPSMFSYTPPPFTMGNSSQAMDPPSIRLHKSFDGGDIFKTAFEIVQSKFPKVDAFPLCIGITSDGTTLNSSRSRSETPLNMFFLNDAPGTMKMMQVGYLPGDNLPFTDSQFIEYMTTGTSCRSAMHDCLMNYHSVFFKQFKKYPRREQKECLKTSSASSKEKRTACIHSRSLSHCLMPR